MKRLLIFLVLTLSVAISVFAVDSSDISFVSYEQGWLDSKGTLALKNNTTEEIRNVKFLITYLDMSGNELDYEEYERRVTIAPGMTKKLDIPAYEHSRNYHYYKSENMPGGSPSFKIKFELKGYNMEAPTTTESDDDYGIDSYDYHPNHSSDYDATFMIIVIIAVLFFIGLSVGLYVLVAVMAQKRHRSVVLWLLLSIVASPLLIIIILLVVGDDNKYVDSFDNTRH